MKRLLASGVLAITLLAVSVSGLPAASLTNYATEADYLAALGPNVLLTTENFDGFPTGTVISNQVAGVVFSSPNEGLPGFVPIQTKALSQVVSPPNALGGGTVETQTVRQAIQMDFSPAASALSFTILAQNPVIREILVTFQFLDGTTQTVSIPDVDNNNNPREFYGVTSDAFDRVTLVSNEASGGLFHEFGGIDNLTFGSVDVLPPVCVGSAADVGGIKGVNGTGTDDRPGDTGIASVALDPLSSNLSLVIDPFAVGDPSATFRVEPSDLTADAQGTVIVTDQAGNSCELCLNFRNLPPGPTFQEVLCCAEGIAFFVSNDNLTPPGPSFCNTSPFGPDQPALPPGYEESPADDPWPCAIFTIDSPIAGRTEMVLKKDGDFDPRLRMVASSSPDGGITFPPFSDVTELVEPILDIIPDPTKLKGKTDWSVVKVACAIQSEICDGLDNDGDGLIDEGLPVGDASVDQDADGFPLCPAPDTTPPDCNDQNPGVNPAAVEICDGIDNDCDGLIDEDDPGGGEACTVPGQMGECAYGVTACIESTIECVQVVEPAPEACDGLDNDCDGFVPADESDADADGYRICEGDCDDTNPAVNPGASEVCNGVDDDCDGTLPADEADADGDGFPVCGGDCDDADASAYPGAAELCDGVDNDCDGLTPAGETDADGDGYRICDGDCDDANAAVNPGATETCNGVDDDCDGTADDGNPGGGAQCGTTDVGVCEFGVTACTGGVIACVGNVEPAPESCGDGLDNDCDGSTDEDVAPVAVCKVSPSNFNVTSESRSFKFSLSSLTNACDPASPVPLDGSAISTAWISRAGDAVLADPATLPCPDPFNGLLGEIGIFENLGARQLTGGGVDLKFNLEADGMCDTQDGSRQEVFALLADALDNSTVPICFSATIDGVAFECCSEAKVTNSGNR